METLDQAYLNDLAEKTRGGSSNAFAELFAASGARQFSYLSGMLMDRTGMTSLFPYATVFVVLASVTMLFVRHGDSKPLPAGSTLEHFGAGD